MSQSALVGNQYRKIFVRRNQMEGTSHEYKGVNRIFKTYFFGVK